MKQPGGARRRHFAAQPLWSAAAGPPLSSLTPANKKAAAAAAALQSGFAAKSAHEARGDEAGDEGRHANRRERGNVAGVDDRTELRRSVAHFDVAGRRGANAAATAAALCGTV